MIENSETKTTMIPTSSGRYLFANEEKKPFKDLTGDEMKIVVDNYCLSEHFDGFSAWHDNSKLKGSLISLDSVIRVKAKPYTIEDARKDVRDAIIKETYFNGCDVDSTALEEKIQSVLDRLKSGIEGKQ